MAFSALTALNSANAISYCSCTASSDCWSCALLSAFWTKVLCKRPRERSHSSFFVRYCLRASASLSFKAFSRFVRSVSSAVLPGTGPVSAVGGAVSNAGVASATGALGVISEAATAGAGVRTISEATGVESISGKGARPLLSAAGRGSGGNTSITTGAASGAVEEAGLLSAASMASHSAKASSSASLKSGDPVLIILL